MIRFVRVGQGLSGSLQGRMMKGVKGPRVLELGGRGGWAVEVR